MVLPWSAPRNLPFVRPRRAGVVPAVLVAGLLASQGLAGKARADDGIGPWVAAEEAELRLVSAVTAIAPGAATVPLGLHFHLSPGWHIYWRTPGSAGMPPQLDWSGSDNLAAAPVAWPAPTRFESFGLQGYGYDTEVVLPIEARLLRPGEAGAFRLAVSYLICREICIPGEAAVALDLVAGPAMPSPAAAELARHRARVPTTPEAAGIALKAVAEPGGIMVIATGSAAFAAPDLFLEWAEPGPYRRPALPRPSLALADAGREAIFRVTVHPPMVRPGTALIVTVTDGPRAVESRLVVEAAEQRP